MGYLGEDGRRGDLRMDGGAKNGDRGGRVAEPRAGLSGLLWKSQVTEASLRNVRAYKGG